MITRKWLTLTVTVKDDERALLWRDGRFERVLGPGRSTFMDPAGHLTAEIVSVSRADFGFDRWNTLRAADPKAAAEMFKVVETKPYEVAIVAFDGMPATILPPFSQRAYWNVLTKVDVEMVDTRGVLRVAPAVAERMDLARSTVATQATVEAYEAGLLFVDGRFVERLPPGRHAFWKTDRDVKVTKVDLRPQAVEITAQEILTKDRIALRVTLTAFWRVTDPERWTLGSNDPATALYRLAQFAVREAVATRTLDEILGARDTIDTTIEDYVRARVGDLGLEVTDIGIKDVILPGEVRELINKVVEAERLAKANIIRRQEETAATRSLLNTAKLMEDNPTLMRLKELEALEKLVEKVGTIELRSADGFDAMLSGLLKKAAAKA